MSAQADTGCTTVPEGLFVHEFIHSSQLPTARCPSSEAMLSFLFEIDCFSPVDELPSPVAVQGSSLIR